jgi:hypothetical protein
MGGLTRFCMTFCLCRAYSLAWSTCTEYGVLLPTCFAVTTPISQTFQVGASDTYGGTTDDELHGHRNPKTENLKIFTPLDPE